MALNASDRKILDMPLERRLATHPKSLVKWVEITLPTFRILLARAKKQLAERTQDIRQYGMIQPVQIAERQPKSAPTQTKRLTQLKLPNAAANAQCHINQIVAKIPSITRRLAQTSISATFSRNNARTAPIPTASETKDASTTLEPSGSITLA